MLISTTPSMQIFLTDAAISALGNLVESPQMRETFVRLGGVAKLLAAMSADCFSQRRAGVGGGGADGAGTADGAGVGGDGSGCRGAAGAAFGAATDKEALLRAQPPPSAGEVSARVRKQAGWILVSLSVDPAVCWAVISEGGVREIVLYGQARAAAPPPPPRLAPPHSPSTAILAVHVLCPSPDPPLRTRASLLGQPGGR